MVIRINSMFSWLSSISIQTITQKESNPVKLFYYGLMGTEMKNFKCAMRKMWLCHVTKRPFLTSFNCLHLYIFGYISQ